MLGVFYLPAKVRVSRTYYAFVGMALAFQHFIYCLSCGFSWPAPKIGGTSVAPACRQRQVALFISGSFGNFYPSDYLNAAPVPTFRKKMRFKRFRRDKIIEKKFNLNKINFTKFSNLLHSELCVNIYYINPKYLLI